LRGASRFGCDTSSDDFAEFAHFLNILINRRRRKIFVGVKSPSDTSSDIQTVCVNADFQQLMM
jgi:hypothetical protein